MCCKRIKKFIKRLIKNRNLFRISRYDPIDGWLSHKVKEGENVTIAIEQSPYYGEQLIISANKTCYSRKKAIKIETNTEIGTNIFLVVVDASKEHVTLMLPAADNYAGELHIVCEDPSFGIEIIPSIYTNNIIFEQSNIKFNAKGDSITLVSDGKFSNNHEINYPGTWYAVGRYTANWYA